MQHLRLSLFISLIGLFSTSFSEAQVQPKTRKSPLAVSFYKIDKLYIKSVFSQPAKNDRPIFGALVPYGEVWRTGANEATEITTTCKVKMGGKTVPAGTYTLFTIPQKDKWTIILNKDLGLWGAFNYKKERDFLRFDVPTTTLDTTWEAFTIKFDKSPNTNTINMNLVWDKTQASVPIDIHK